MGTVLWQLQQQWTRERFVRQTERFLPALYRTARRLTRDPADAEDLVHDTYVKAFQAFDRAALGSAEACRAWLFRIMVNAYRDRYRRQQRSPEVQPVRGGDEGADNVFDATVSPEPDPEVLLGRKHFAAAAQTAMAALSPEVRLVVTLFFVDGFAYKEIADLLGCPIGTVMSRLARGRRLLQQRLQAYGNASDLPTTALPPSTLPSARQRPEHRGGVP